MGSQFLESVRYLLWSIYFLSRELEEFQAVSKFTSWSFPQHQLLMFPRKIREEDYCMPVFQGGRVWLGGQADLESNAIKPQQNAFVYDYYS